MRERADTPPETGRWRTWCKRLGVAGFAFFLIKGMVWLALAGAAAAGVVAL